MQSPSRLVWLVWAGLSIVFAYSLTLPVATLPGNRPWLRRFDTPEIAEGRVFSQTFTMDRDGLTAIEFNFDPVGPPSWQWSPAFRDTAKAVEDPVTAASYYTPLIDELERQGGPPGRLEIPFTNTAA